MGDIDVDPSVFIELIDESVVLFDGKEELEKLESISRLQKELKRKYKRSSDSLSQSLNG